jgi:hypothetical protein
LNLTTKNNQTKEKYVNKIHCRQCILLEPEDSYKYDVLSFIKINFGFFKGKSIKILRNLRINISEIFSLENILINYSEMKVMKEIIEKNFLHENKFINVISIDTLNHLAC